MIEPAAIASEPPVTPAAQPSKRKHLTQEQLAEILKPFAEATKTDENFANSDHTEAFLLIMGWFYAFRCDVFAGALRKLKVGKDYGYDGWNHKQRSHLRTMLNRGQRSGILLRKNGKNSVAVEWLGKENDPTITLGILLDCMVMTGEIERVGHNPKDGYVYQIIEPKPPIGV